MANLSYKNEDGVIEAAVDLLRQRLAKSDDVITSTALAKDYLRLNMAALDHETFWLVLLDAAGHVITTERVFEGTLDQVQVHLREVFKHVLNHNAAQVILAHNHPSGLAEPSEMDLKLTQRVIKALKYIDVRVLDHIIVAGVKTYSFAENSMLNDRPNNTWAELERLIGTHPPRPGAAFLGEPTSNHHPVLGTVVINIGLDVKDGERLDPLVALGAVEYFGIKVLDSTVRESDTEPTLVALLDRPLEPWEAFYVAVALQQEAIVQTVNGVGKLYGPDAAKWGDFDPERFLQL